jgi:hypothetical protein
MSTAYYYQRTRYSGLTETWCFSQCTAEQADAAAVEQGWVPPRWWQWWRRRDFPHSFYGQSAPDVNYGRTNGVRSVRDVRMSLNQPAPETPTDAQLDELFAEIDQSGESESWRPFARAVLARWGKQ